eukprot:946004-Rhodomonas_salina.1
MWLSGTVTGAQAPAAAFEAAFNGHESSSEAPRPPGPPFFLPQEPESLAGSPTHFNRFLRLDLPKNNAADAALMAACQPTPSSLDPRLHLRLQSLSLRLKSPGLDPTSTPFKFLDPRP